VNLVRFKNLLNIVFQTILAPRLDNLKSFLDYSRSTALIKTRLLFSRESSKEIGFNYFIGYSLKIILKYSRLNINRLLAHIGKDPVMAFL